MKTATRHEIRINRSKPLAEDSATGHNRWHPDIPPVIRCDSGDEVVLETRDALDGQVGPDSSLEAVAGREPGPPSSANRPGVRRGCRTG